MRGALSVTAVVSVLSLTPFVARAGLIAPGEIGSGHTFVLDAPPAGTVVAERTVPFEFTAPPENPDPDNPVDHFARGTITSRVLREDATGRLTFVYQATQSSTNSVLDLDAVAVVGFAGFTTDVLTDQPDPRVNRQADGDAITLTFDGPEDAEGLFVVRTNATAFKELAEGLAIEIVFQPDGTRVSQFFDTFQPAADAGPGPAPIPLPPAAASAIAAVISLASIRAARNALSGGRTQV
jgi:hypothetical protein